MIADTIRTESFAPQNASTDDRPYDFAIGNACLQS